MRINKKLRRTAPTKRLPRINWKSPVAYPTGGSYQDSPDGMFRLALSDSIDGIPLPREYRLWQFKRGRWVRIDEGRSRSRMEKTARLRAAELDSDDDE